MAGDRVLTYVIAGDARKLQTSLDTASTSVDKASGHFSKLTGAVKGAVGGFAALEAGKAVVDFLEGATKAAMADELAMARVGTSVHNAGEKWSALKKPIDDALTSMSNTSGFMKSDLANAFSKLETATGNHTKALNLEVLAENLAAQRGVPLQTAVKAISNAYVGSATALRRYGVVVPTVNAAEVKLKDAHDKLLASGVKLTAAQKDAYTASMKVAQQQDKQRQSVDLLDKAHAAFAGGLEARNKTMAGQLDIFNARWENIKVQVGDAILPLLTKGMGDLLTGMTAAMDWWDKTGSPDFQATWTVIGPAVTNILEGWVIAFSKVATATATMVSLVKAVVHGDWTTAWDDAKSIVNDLLTAVNAVLLGIPTKLKDSVGTIKTDATNLGNAIADNIKDAPGKLGDWLGTEIGKLPGVIRGALGDVGSAALDLGNKVETQIEAGVTGIGSWLTTVVGNLADDITGALPSIGTAALKLGGKVVSGFTSGLAGFAAALASDLVAPINAVINGWNGISFSLPGVDTHIPGVGKIGGFTLSTPNVPTISAATGGITRGPTALIAGDNPGGSEALIPLNSSSAKSMLGGGDTYNITVNGILDGAHGAKVIVDALITHKRRGNNNLALAV